MYFCLFYAFTIVSPCHGESCVNKGAVNGDKVSQFGVIFWEYASCFFLKPLKNSHELLKASGVDGLKEAALLNALLGSNMLPCILVFLKRLNKFPS